MQIFKRKGRPALARWQIGGQDVVRATGKTNRARALESLHRFVSESQNDQSLAEPFQRLLRLLEIRVPDRGRPAPGQCEANPGEGPRGPAARGKGACPDEIARELRSEQDQKVRIAEGWAEWRRCANRESEPKERTLAGYEAMWTRFQTWAAKTDIAFLHEVTRSHAEAYAADLWSSSVSPSTFNQHLKFVRSVFTTLETRAGVLSNPWAHLKTRKRALNEGRRNLTEPELSLVLNRAEGTLKLMFCLGLFTGLRLGDVVNLRWDNIEFDPVLRQARPGFIVLVPLKRAGTARSWKFPSIRRWRSCWRNTGRIPGKASCSSRRKPGVRGQHRERQPTDPALPGIVRTGNDRAGDPRTPTPGDRAGRVPQLAAQFREPVCESEDPAAHRPETGRPRLTAADLGRLPPPRHRAEAGSHRLVALDHGVGSTDPAPGCDPFKLSPRIARRAPNAHRMEPALGDQPADGEPGDGKQPGGGGLIHEQRWRRAGGGSGSVHDGAYSDGDRTPVPIEVGQ